MANNRNERLTARYRLPLLLLLYPALTLLLANLSGADSSPSERTRVEQLIAPVNTAVLIVIALSLLFVPAVPFWSSRYRSRPLIFARAFRGGLYITSALIVVILPTQGLLMALALYISDPSELWFWGIFVAGGAIFATVVLLRSGLNKKPGIYSTLRAARVQLEQHPKLELELRQIAEAANVPLPAAILVGLQPELIATVATVFSPDGEFNNGVLCFSLPTSSVLSIAEFRALAAEALLYLHASYRDGRTDFASTAEAATDVLKDLDDTMRQWSWIPKFVVLHPAILVFRLILVASMQFPLYIGKELLTYFLEEFWATRQAVDVSYSVEAHRHAADEVGAVHVISALIKETAICVAMPLVDSEGEAIHALREVTNRVAQEHPDLRFDYRNSSSLDPITAWRYLQFRSSLSGVGLEWCRQRAMDVKPEPSAASLFEDVKSLQRRLMELANSPLVRVAR